MASKLKLFESDDDDSDPENCKLTINKEYAEKYTAWKEKEELQKLKEKYGDLSDYSSSEDEEEVNWNSEFDKEWLRVFSAVKFKDKDIYDREVKFVRDEDENEDKDEEEEDSDSDNDSSTSEESEKEKVSKKKKETDDTPLTIREHERRIITDRNGMVSESEDEDEVRAQTLGPSYHEEQEAIRKNIREVLAGQSSDDDDDILTHRVKTDKEKRKEEEEYLQFLKGEKEAEDLKSRDKKIAKDLAPLRTFFAEEGEEDEEAKKVVWNTLICRGTLKEKEEDAEEEEIEEESQMMLMEEDEEQFEHTYNFRFEEPDKVFIKQYKRNPDDVVRQEVNKRSVKRKEVQQRKKTALEERREEIRRLRKLKRKEVEKRLQLLMKECPSGVEFNPDDLTGDFDPKLYDKMMQEKFDKMNEDNGDDDEDEEKPDMADLEDVLSIDSYEDIFEEGDKSIADRTFGEEEEEEGEEEDEEEPGTSGTGGSQSKVHAGYDPSWLPDMSRSTRKDRRRRKSKFQQALDAEKPLFSQVADKYKGSQSPWEDYVQEYYKLDYKEHGFHYRNVVPNSYGVDPAEILWLPTRELNAWVSMKKVVEPKSESDELHEQHKYQSAKMQRKIMNIMPSLKKIEDEESKYEDIRPSVLREQKLARLAAEDNSDMSESEEQPSREDLGTPLLTDSQTSPEKKKKKKRKVIPGESVETGSQPSPAKKKKRKVHASGSTEPEALPQKKKKASDSGMWNSSQDTSVTDQVDEQGREGKKKKKKKLSVSDGKGNEDNHSQGETETNSEMHPEGKKKKKQKKMLESDTKESNVKEVKDSSKISGDHKTKKKKKQASEGEKQTPQKSGKEKLKGKKKKPKGPPKVKGYIAKDRIQESRLAAFHIDPRKFKYTKDRIVPLQTDQE